jgi:hypothetical protein
VGVTALVVVLLAACGWVISQQFTSSSARHRNRPAAVHFTPFEDGSGLFVGAYPSNWKVVHTGNPQIDLLVQGPGGASFLVRTSGLTAAVGLGNLAAAKKLTDRVVHSDKTAKLLRPPEQVALGGMPGYLYLYTFTDPSTGNIGAHAHYFVFDGKTMIMLVFQSLPSSNFTSEAGTFDRIAATFRFSASKSK